ncbi:hypothetical protein CH379_006635 [Leptospira ellisii]|uniref:Uncharacterized protein n=1 Tax=Leptospira ellisii TaxID=2023197 RepID=A0AAE4QM20_9LEPT|nr:hypothetical protein [Leptospira ellisii]MDV6235301.1 hypothetical protein [Leptospira ellisii]
MIVVLAETLTGLTWQGNLIMYSSLLLVTALSVFCIVKLFQTRNH